jgi:hypothetical protein
MAYMPGIVTALSRPRLPILLVLMPGGEGSWMGKQRYRKDHHGILFRHKITSLFPNRITMPRTAFEQNRQGITWSPIFRFRSKQYILSPVGVHEFIETAFGLNVSAPIQFLR